AAVGRLPHAVAPRGRLAVVRFTAAHPNDVWVLLRDGDIADREQSLVLQKRREARAVARRLPHAAVRRTHVPDRRVLLEHGEVGDASRHNGRTYRPEVQLLELLRNGRGALRERQLSREGDKGGRQCDTAHRADHWASRHRWWGAGFYRRAPLAARECWLGTGS